MSEIQILKEEVSRLKKQVETLGKNQTILTTTLRETQQQLQNLIRHLDSNGNPNN